MRFEEKFNLVFLSIHKRAKDRSLDWNFLFFVLFFFFFLMEPYQNERVRLTAMKLHCFSLGICFCGFSLQLTDPSYFRSVVSDLEEILLFW